MPMNDQDARALTYLAGRIRQDTYGANTWDEPGIFAVISELAGQSLALTIERVARHAADPGAKTPGAIRRPFIPDAQGSERPPLDVAPVGSRCTTCGEIETRCREFWLPHCDPPDKLDEAQGRHVFTRPIPRDVDLAPVVAELKGHIA